jgi:L-lactate utilization protein LutC
MRFPFFTLRVDSQNYHIHSSRAFKQSLSVKTPAEKEFYSNSVQNYHLNDLKARTSSKIFALIVERLEKSSPDEMHTPETVSLMLRDGMAKHVLTVNRERESLIQQLDLVRDVLAPLEKEVENAKEAANIKSKRAGLTFVGVIMAQFALSQYGTYVFFSWDIMEPICACVTLSDAIAGYYFWLYSGKPWDLDSFKSFWYEREL